MAESNADKLPSNSELRTAIEAFVRSGGDSKNQDAVFRSLARAILIFPSVSSAVGKVSLAFIKDPKGALLTPAFTDAQALLAWAPSGQSVSTAEASGFIPALLAGPTSGIVVNPGSEASLVFNRKMLENLAGRLRRR
jgi:fructose-specific phosphotransferase system IIC component